MGIAKPYATWLIAIVPGFYALRPLLGYSMYEAAENIWRDEMIPSTEQFFRELRERCATYRLMDFHNEPCLKPQVLKRRRQYHLFSPANPYRTSMTRYRIVICNAAKATICGSNTLDSLDWGIITKTLVAIDR